MFKFDLEHKVKISVSGEEGAVVGRAEYVSSSKQYLVRYKSGDGRAEEKWWDEVALESCLRQF